MKTLLTLVLLSLAVPAFSASFDKNVPEEIKQQMITDMNFVATIKGSTTSPLHTQIFGNVDGAAYVNFFDTRVKSVGLSSCGSSIAVACVQPMMGANKMWITNNYIKFSHPQIARSMVVFHEARHTESNHGFWSHATCPKPFLDPQGKPITSIWTGSNLAGEPACDITPLGSYGSSVIMMKNISKFCANCTDKVKMDAGLYADDQFKRVIDPKASAAIKKDLYENVSGFIRR